MHYNLEMFILHLPLGLMSLYEVLFFSFIPFLHLDNSAFSCTCTARTHLQTPLKQLNEAPQIDKKMVPTRCHASLMSQDGAQHSSYLGR